jgi:CubicO group peptidase (beta-lactamase class C family)
VCVLAAAAASVWPATPPAKPDPIDAMLRQAIPADGPGVAVIAVKDGKTVFRKAYGMANLELGVPLSPDSVFRLGSITKQFTAVSILMLAEEGKLALDDPITKFLPDYPTQGHTITVEHLLTHSSGIQSYTDMPGWMASKVAQDLTLTELIDGFKKEPMQFAPGERYRYNNSGFVLLGAIVEKASGLSYAEFLKQRIFAPLGMKSSSYGDNGPLLAKRASGYTLANDQPANARYLSMTQPHAAGAIVSSVDDLALWDAALYEGKPVKAAWLEKAWTPYKLKDGKDTGYGYGWAIGKLRGRRVIEHGGGIFGFVTHALRIPEGRVYVAVLGNLDRPKVGPNYLAKKIAAHVLGDPFPERTPVALDAMRLERYAGVYEVNKDNRRTVSVEGGRLFTQRGGGPRAEAKPYSETEFFYESSLTTLRFVVGADGRATEMLVHPDGADEPERALRVPEPAGK